MASQCKRQQCTIDRRGFRQELDSWRHKLIHCVGFESILEGLFGPELVEDLKLFKDLEPVAASDWSFDENCQFCCLRRDKVKEHLIGLNKEGLQDTLKPHLAKDHAAISKLEKQAEEFLNAVLSRKDVPSFSDPHIPVVAREILQRMIRQFAAEYTSKNSPPQDSCSDNQPSSDQSLPNSQQPPSSPAAAVAGPAHSLNPVLSKLLMADQDAPLDLTIKKPQSEPSEQDGVLDLSIKKNRYSSSAPVHSPSLSPLMSTLKGESQDLRLAKPKELQSTTSLEQFIAKLCVHHQRQIVTALGYLQTELKSHPNTPPTPKTIGATTKPITVTPVKLFDVKMPCTSTPKVEVHDVSVTLPRVKKSARVSMTSAVDISAVAANLPSPGCKTSLAEVAPAEATSVRQSDHVPLKMKIMKTSNVATGKKLSCVLTTSISSDLENSGGRSDHTKSLHSARLSSSSKKQSHSSHLIKSLGHYKDALASPFTVRANVPPDLPRTARKSIRPADQNAKECAQRIIVDPDIGQCDIVYINKPITECFKEPQRHMTPRRNARKSTRGHMYSDDFWVVKTVRTLAGRGNCPNPMPDLITLVTPKQMISKPESVPPVDTPLVGACVETAVDSGSTDNPFDRAIVGSEDVVEVAVNEADVGVESSQTDQQLTTQDSDLCEKRREHEEVEQNGNVSSGRENEAPVDSETNMKSERKLDPTVPEKLENFGAAVVEVSTFSSDGNQTDNSGFQTSQETANDVIQEEKQGTPDEKQDQQYHAPVSCEIVTQKTDTAASERSENVEAIPATDVVSPVQVIEEAVEDVKDVSSKALDEELPPPLVKRGSVSVAPEPVEVIVGYVNGKPVSASDRSLRHKLTTSPLITKTDKAISKRTAPVRASTAQIQADEGQSSHTAPTVAQTKAQTLDKPSCLKSKSPANVKQMRGEKRKVSDPAGVSEQPEPKRQLRSASQKAAAALASSSKSSASTKKTSLAVVPTIPSEEQSAPCGEATASPKLVEDQVSSSSAKPDLEEASTKVDDLPPESSPNDCISSCAPQLPPSPVQPSEGLESGTSSSTSHQIQDGETITPSHEHSGSPLKPEDGIIGPAHLPSASPEETQESQPQLNSSQTPEAPKLPSASSSKKSSLKLGHEKDKSPGDSEETFKSKRLQAKQRLRSAKVTEESQPGTKALSPLPSQNPSTSRPEDLCPVSASSKCTTQDITEDKNQKFEAKPKLRSARVGEDLGCTDSTQSPTGEASQSSPGSASVQCMAPTNVEKALLDMVPSGDTPTDTPETPLLRQKLRSARVRDIADNQASAETSASARLESESLNTNITAAKALDETATAETPARLEDRPTRMPLRSESSKVERPLFNATDAQKPNLRSQKHPTSDTADTSATKKSDLGSPSKVVPKKSQRVPPTTPTSPAPSARPLASPQNIRSRAEPSTKADKFFELLNQEENKQLLTNLNIRFDKMQKGWVQLDREGQPGTKSKSKADRQAVIWKSKRRIRKPKLPEHQKYSPVQMLFMRGFDLPSICRWFLESTETKSLVIVKKVNTRLPSETQLCFHGSSSSSGGSLGIFPSVQAERLKKHLKKFAIASPVKSNPKSQKLIAKVLGLEAVRGKDKRDIPSSSQTSTKSRPSTVIPKQKSETQKAKPKNPTSARILRKYSNIRGKMQVQHSGTRLKDSSGSLKTKNVKPATTKSDSKSNPKTTVKSPKPPVSKQARDSTDNSETSRTIVAKTSTKVAEKPIKVQKTNKVPTKNSQTECPKRCSQRIGSPKLPAPTPPADSVRSKPEKKESDKREVRKSPLDRQSLTKVPTKPTSTPSPDSKKSKAGPGEQSSDVTPTGDQVLTRSQKKMEAAGPQTKKSSNPLNKAARSSSESRKLAARPPMTRSGTLTGNARLATVGPSAAKKAKKRALEILSTPAKRTRISLSK